MDTTKQFIFLIKNMLSLRIQLYWGYNLDSQTEASMYIARYEKKCF